ncbi:peptide ABC transporter substrate-binding protein [Phaeobacter gallaeciensis]|jgi:peptide/nickel transport system substrate-binding protein|uniref:ABC transporter substrate-binding protein n=1 Tax=Phaeobacter gallaeciensis TaxID=60890 RepID=A0A1B0ZQ32_9RHOB|nr:MULTISPECIES: ABC transporter substrate-binding protein [Phaeobacter]MDF1772175.1 ABC transporter substrate-binding protein [Pseudophaeobacter sp. bin_em_oilr2.035]ANP36231.1 peptide ABC transporter substrate-binding protein [Phaeobacter gallaeciensis]MDE4060705.1 ABC transporter substrate-binding protein [Phaeobacter gallaeciensis]MDE4123868.1 ABC transporter substrate-binding protein [Phaeobacter gallaeciensis]MDE4128194.1 ABC transporter substrate-binding protein [Phaeobacter gallaeciens
MKLMSRLLGAAAFAALSSTALPAFADGGTLVIASSQVPRHLNGAVQSGIATAVPSTQIFASPIRYDENWEPQPYLAKSWETSEDGLTVTLNLVDNATFHDGEPITSEDVAYSILTTKENHPFKSMFAPVESIDTPDAHTVVINLSNPHPALLLALSPALAPVLPKHVFDDGQDIKSHPMNSKPVGSGPFMLEEFKAGEAIVLKKNPNFFLDGRPKLDEIIVRIIKDPSALLIAMENGEADMYPFMAGSQEIRRLEKADHLGVTAEGYAAVGPLNWLAFNTASPKLSDVRVRQAIAYAVDRDFITKALHRGVSTPQRGPIIESSPFFDESIPAYDADLDKAKALMAEAGFADGMELTIDFIPGPKEQQQSIAEYMKSQLKKIGIAVTVRAAPDFPTWAGRVGGHDFELTMDIVFNWGDPVIGVHRTYLSDNIRQGVIWSNTQQYANAKVDELLNAAAIESDPAKRKELYAEFQQIVANDLPVYWINALPYHTAYDKKLMNVPTGIWGTMHPMDMVSWGE